jgi:hypothetical protein
MNFPTSWVVFDLTEDDTATLTISGEYTTELLAQL